MQNREVAEVFEEIADILDIQGDNPFRIRSYRNAARTIEDLPENIAALAMTGADLQEIKGIGKSIAEKICEIARTGKCSYLEDLKKKTPEGLTKLLEIAGVGPRKVKVLYEKLGVDSIDRLEKAARAGKLKKLAGMGEKTEENILKAIEHHKEGTGRFLLSDGLEYANTIIEHLKSVKGVQKMEAAGSLRRRKETIGDVDILAICSRDTSVMKAFTEYESVSEVLAKGDTKSSVRMRNGLQVDLRVLDKKNFGAALHYFTGSKEHNILIRDRAKERGLKVSEYGVFDLKTGKRKSGASEEEIFAAAGLPYIVPELREARGEIEAAEKRRLPELVELKDIRGDLQMHTNATDGKDSIREMAEKAARLGYEYIAITDHSKAVRVAGGLDEKQMLKHLKNIERENAGEKRLRILKGAEVDILADGKLDLPDNVLRECDVVLAAVHSGFNMTEEEMTRRVISAIKNPAVNIFAHPTGRLVLGRPPYAINLKEVAKAAADNNVACEINAYPDRLDLNDINARMARDAGARIAISTDAHSAAQLEVMKFGVYTARRGWITANDVINTLPLDKLLKVLRKR